jgi:hypothetical protein
VGNHGRGGDGGEGVATGPLATGLPLGSATGWWLLVVLRRLLTRYWRTTIVRLLLRWRPAVFKTIYWNNENKYIIKSGMNRAWGNRFNVV